MVPLVAMRLIPFAAQQAPVPAYDVANSGYPIERSACLTIALGPAAAAECGNLRVIHPLPSVRTLNKVRTPVLLYNSEFAHPYPYAPVNVTLTSTTTTPDSVEVVLYVTRNGVEAERARKRWAGSEWPANQTTTRRVAIAYDAVAAGDTTGHYPYRIEVANLYPGGVRLAAPSLVGARMFIVNQQASRFGAGWWLVGLERLISLATPEKIWIGGDGSTRYFAQVWPPAPKDTIWTTPFYGRVDTLYWNLAQGRYIRTGAGGVQVKFDATGKHVATVDRFGRTTTFTYSLDTLKTIIIPPNNLTYTFGYTAGRLTSVTSPPIGAQTRVAALLNVGGNLTSIRNVTGDSAATFTYLSTAGSQSLMSSRKNRRAVIDSFTYDSARRVRSSRLKMSAGSPDIVWTLLAGETRGLPKSGTPSSVDTTKVYTHLDGPRLAPVADTTVIYQSRFGPTRKLIDAAAFETRVLPFPEFQGNGFGWLPQRAQYPTGRVMRAGYDARANVSHLIDSATIVPGQSDTTRYLWDPKFDQLTRLVPPERDSTVFWVSGTNGRRDSAQDARGSVSRVRFGYDPSNADLLLTMTLPAVGGQTAAYTNTYDATRRNLASVQTPKGFLTNYTTDEVGRVIRTESRIDTLASSAKRVRHAQVFDLLDRVLRDTLTTASVTPSELVLVQNFYNPEGQLDSVRRSMIPDPKAIGVMSLKWRYDAAGRTVAAVAPDGARDSTVFDPAGNPTVLVTRRYSAMPVVLMQYDALNRLTERILPAFIYASRNDGIPTWRGTQLNNPYPAYPIPADTARFTYAPDGQLLTADNGDARVKRSYVVSGLLGTDTLFLRTVQGSSFTQHGYGITYRYDRNGRRRTLKVPAQLVTPGQDSIRTTYTAWGAVDHIYDLFGNDYAYGYTERSEPKTLGYTPGQILHQLTYDPDGRVVGDTILNQGGTSFPRFAAAQLRRTRLWYDARAKVDSSVDGVAFQDTLSTDYSGLGYVTKVRLVQHGNLVGLPGWPPIATRFASTETPTYDPLGNITGGVFTDTTKIGTGSPSWTWSNRVTTYASAVGRLMSETTGNGTRTYVYDSAGQNEFVKLVGLPNTPSEDRASFYDALGQLRAADRRWVGGQGVQASPGKYTFEEYRYDALGRRVWVRARRSCEFIVSPPDNLVECQVSTVRRTVWDGTQELAEIQAPGAPADSLLWERDTGYVQLPQIVSRDPNPYYGRVVYAYGLTADQPVSVARFGYADHPTSGSYTTWPAFVILPFWNTRGQAVVGTFSNGQAGLQYQAGGTQCANPPSNQRCVLLDWPLSWSAYDQRKGIVMRSWQGTLLEDKRDKAGTDYRRNRYYDPVAGRFTQEDPIGLAGGLNAYGFADSDPVNLGDPFGLCPACIAYAIFEIGSSLYDAFDLGRTAVAYARGRASKAQLGVTAAGAAAGIWSVGGGLGAAGRAGLGSLTKGNFRENLARTTGGAVKGAHAHHIFPQEFAERFAKSGINIHEPQFGAWWEAGSHLRNAAQYNVDWARFLSQERTADEIMSFGRQLSARYGITARF